MFSFDFIFNKFTIFVLLLIIKKMAKQKRPESYYRDAENADNLNKYQAFRKEFEKNLPKRKPRVIAKDGPTVVDRQRGKALIEQGYLKPTIDSTIGKLTSKSSRADSVKAYTNLGKGVAIAEKNRIQADKSINAAYAGKEKRRIARADATSSVRNLAIPLSESSGWRTPEEDENFATMLKNMSNKSKGK
jgi:hypothetical protein